MEFEGILILHELPLQPNSYLDRIVEGFEKPSIVRVVSRDELRGYSKAPLFDKKHLVIFEAVDLFKANLGYIKLDIMFVVVQCTANAQVTDVIDICQHANLKYRVVKNPFEKADAVAMVMDLAKGKVSNSFCEKLVQRVGRSPKRIISAMTVLEQTGYSTANISKYVDKYIYIKPGDVIWSLLGICKSRAQVKRAALFLHMNRLWYAKYTKAILIQEVDFIIRIYNDALRGVVTRFNLLEYLEENRFSRFRVSTALDMMEYKSVTELMSLRLFLESATLLEVAMRLM